MIWPSKCPVEDCDYLAYSAHELEAHTGLVHEQIPATPSALDAEGQAIVDLARFIFETHEDAARIHGLVKFEHPRFTFESLAPEHIKTLIAVAREVRERFIKNQS